MYTLFFSHLDRSGCLFFDEVRLLPVVKDCFLKDDRYTIVKFIDENEAMKYCRTVINDSDYFPVTQYAYQLKEEDLGKILIEPRKL